jgi:nicotinate-nucleotide adenylyltransferase
MKTVVFGGAFDPPHLEHSRLTKFACKFLGAERLIIVPTHNPPHKSGGSLAFEHRVQLAKMAFADCAPVVMVDEIEQQRALDGCQYNYTSEVLPILKAKYGDIVYLIGGDSVEHFDTWHKPEDVGKVCPIAVVGRAGYHNIDEKIDILTNRFGGEFIRIDFDGQDVASSTIKAKLLLGIKPEGILDDVYDYLTKNKLFDKYKPWLEKLEQYQSPELFNHTKNVVLRAVHLNSLHNLKQDFDKVFVSALLHDNAKERLSLDGLNVPKDSVGTSVLHQFLGAEKAKRDFGIDDKDIIDAISVHTTACKNMTTLQKLIYTADSTSYDREYSPIPELREVGDKDFHEGFLVVLRYTHNKLLKNGKSIYPLTLDAVNQYL